MNEIRFLLCFCDSRSLQTYAPLLKAAYFAQGCDPHPTYRPTATLLALIAASIDSTVKGF